MDNWQYRNMFIYSCLCRKIISNSILAPQMLRHLARDEGGARKISYRIVTQAEGKHSGCDFKNTTSAVASMAAPQRIWSGVC